MALFSSQTKPANKKDATHYERVVTVAKVFAPIFRILSYVFGILVVLFLIVAAILPLIALPADEMVLPPFVAIADGTYTASLGDGLALTTTTAMTQGQIKQILYADLIRVVAVLGLLIPIFVFLSRLMKNIGQGNLFLLKNPQYLRYLALTVMIGDTAVRILRRLSRYMIGKVFVPDAVTPSIGFDWGGIAVGLVIFFIAYLYGHICRTYLKDTAGPVNLPNAVETYTPPKD